MSPTTQRAKRRTAEEWENLVQECLDGAHKKTEFCKERGLNYPAFMTHCARIRKRSITVNPASSSQLIAMKLVTGTDDTPSGTRNPVLCSLHLKNGTVLHIHDRQCLADIVTRLTPDASIL